MSSLLAALHRLDTAFDVTGDGRVVPPGTAGARAHVPSLTPDRLGDPSFRADYGLRVAYVGGGMANAIGSAELAIALGEAGALGFFGAAGVSIPRIAAAIDQLEAALPGRPWGCNLIHAPSEPDHEQATVDLYLARGVRVVEAAAYLQLTPMVVQYRAAGLRARPDGGVAIGNRVIAKVSREEVAEKFLRPAPAAMLEALVAKGRITREQAQLAARVPMADDLTAEADSGGHTDNRPLAVLLPVLVQQRDRIAAELPATARVRIGAAGGLGTPDAVAAAFALGAAYVLVGTVHQACVESGTSGIVREMLAKAAMPDVAMAPASDMFEAGVQVQVLRRGTLFPQRARLLYELYREHASLETLPPDVKQRVEGQILRRSCDEVWRECEAFFARRDPKQLARAATDPKHKMALVFRWYLGMSSKWAIAGEADRATDFQVWCGPAIGSFNAWTRDTFLAAPAERRAAVVAANLMAGAAALTRARMLQLQGVEPGAAALRWAPRRVAG